MVQPAPSASISPPEPPKGLSKDVAAAWRTFWSSPLAAQTTEADLIALRRLFRLYDQRERFARAGMKDPLAHGSAGQLALNPFLKHVPTLDAEILALEDRFGLSPMARLKLQVTLGDAADGLAKLKAALLEEDEPDEDIRLAVVGDAAALGESAAAD